MLISPTEPAQFHSLGTLSSYSENFGCDFLIVSTAMGIRIGIQRKQFPGDFLSSLADGRLYEQVHKMQPLEMKVVIVEGMGKWTAGGELLDITRFTKAQMYGLFLSLHYEFGCEVLQVRDMRETIEVLTALENWSKKKEHKSLKSRPGPKKNSWGRVDNRDYAIHLLQSFKGIGPGAAAKIFDHFGRLPLRWDITEEDLLAIPGIGRGKARDMMDSLRVGDESGEKK